MKSTEANHVVFYDGHCLLCNGAIKFLIRHDKHHVLKFAALQSDFAKEKLSHLKHPWPDSIIYYTPNKTHIKSSAVLNACIAIRWYFKPLAIFYIFPAFIRNAVYDFIAKNRYRWFGKDETCLLPSAYQDRIIT